MNTIEKILSFNSMILSYSSLQPIVSQMEDIAEKPVEYSNEPFDASLARPQQDFILVATTLIVILIIR